MYFDLTSFHFIYYPIFHYHKFQQPIPIIVRIILRVVHYQLYSESWFLSRQVIASIIANRHSITQCVSVVNSGSLFVLYKSK